MEKNLSDIAEYVTDFFNKVAQKAGVVSRFVKRSSKLSSSLFAKMLLRNAYTGNDMSLERMSQYIKEEANINITKQGIDERFTPEATDFMKYLFKESLVHFEMEKLGGIDILKPFTSLYLLDSTNISLPASMKEMYPGFGGSASEAGLKIQVLFDYTENQIQVAEITEGRKNDQSYNGHLKSIKQGALYLHDLGYFKMSSFNKIHAAGAYFISRYLSGTGIYDEEGKPVEILKELEATYDDGKDFYTKKIKLGKSHQVPVRLVAFRFSEEYIQQRHEEIRKKAKRKHREPKEETFEYAKWSIHVTNVAENILTDQQVKLVYELRWQIELFFKLSKSGAGIDKINSKNPDRIQCSLYASLISIMMLLCFCKPVRWLEAQEISLYKAYKLLKQKVGKCFEALKTVSTMQGFLKEFLDDIKLFGMKDKSRKKRRLSYQKLMDSTGQKTLTNLEAMA